MCFPRLAPLGKLLLSILIGSLCYWRFIDWDDVITLQTFIQDFFSD